MNALQDHGSIYEDLRFYGHRKQIRLLRLPDYEANVVQQKSLDDPEPLEFELEVYPLWSTLAYDAISYAWGEAAPTREISVNGVKIKVGENCHYSLLQARLQRTSYIWIDAICINQQDVDEKGHQVEIMYSIFSGARRVLACIGPADDVSDRILAKIPMFPPLDAQLFEELVNGNQWSFPGYTDKSPDPGWAELHHRMWTLFWDGMQSMNQSGTCVRNKSALHGYTDVRIQFCKDFNTLFRRPYFQRLWVAKEIHAGGVGCLFLVGASSFWREDLETIRQAALAAFNHADPQHEKPAFLLLEMLHMQQKKRCVRLAQYLLCSDPRDRVYGTLGIYGHGREATIVPDYNKSAFEIALDLSRSDMHDFYELQSFVEALEIRFHHSRLTPHFASHDAARSASLAEKRSWNLYFTVWRMIDSLDALELQDATKAHVPVNPNLPQGKHKTRKDTNSDDFQSFAIECDRLLHEKRVVKGIAGSRFTRDEWILPVTARVGDTILSTRREKPFEKTPESTWTNDTEDLALVARIGPTAETCTVVGLATYIHGSASGLVSATMRQRWRDQLWWPRFDINFDATVEEMMPLVIPRRDDLLHARHAFRLPQCDFVMAYAWDSSDDAYRSGEDGRGVLGKTNDRTFVTERVPKRLRFISGLETITSNLLIGEGRRKAAKSAIKALIR